MASGLGLLVCNWNSQGGFTQYDLWAHKMDKT